jgi:hypothetical protein
MKLPISLLTLALPLCSFQQKAPETPGLLAARGIVRVLIGALIVLLLSYIVIEQVGSRRRKRSGND